MNSTFPGHPLFRAAPAHLPQSIKDLGRRGLLNIQLLPRSLPYCNQFSKISKYVFFVGYPRSGSTLFGSMLNAHPNVVISHELNALNYVRIGLHRYAIYYLILQRDREFGMIDRKWTGYEYKIDGQWQGKYSKLCVIGDKKSGGSSVLLGKYPYIWQRLKTVLRVPIKIIHYVRNPFDNITTIARHDNQNLGDAIRAYFHNAAIVDNVKRGLSDSEFLELFHEDTITDPKGVLRTALSFLDLPYRPDYVEACAAIVFSQPRRTRHDGGWTADRIAEVRERCAGLKFLTRYDFDER